MVVLTRGELNVDLEDPAAVFFAFPGHGEAVGIASTTPEQQKYRPSDITLCGLGRRALRLPDQPAINASKVAEFANIERNVRLTVFGWLQSNRDIRYRNGGLFPRLSVFVQFLDLRFFRPGQSLQTGEVLLQSRVEFVEKLRSLRVANLLGSLHRRCGRDCQTRHEK